MKKLLLLIITALLIMPGAQVGATTTPTLLYSFETRNTDSGLIEGANWAFQTFTTGSVSHTITSVRLNLRRTNGEPGIVTVSLRATDTGEPTGTDITSATADGDLFGTSYAWQVFTFSEITLEAETMYAIVVRAAAASSPVGIYWGQNSTGGYTGGTNGTSTNSGSTWSIGTADNNFRVYGRAAVIINRAAVFQDYIETGDLLFTIEYVNTYAPYYPYDDPARYFYIQLRDTNGTTILANTVMRAWGNQPGSIYLSANAAAPLTIGASYYLAL
jgi:hypothetical protein